MQAAEKRHSPRCSVPAFVPNGRDPNSMYTLDLSRTGMRFVRLHEPAPETPVFAIAVPLPGTGNVVHALAETIRKDRRGPVEEVAVRFRYLAPEDQRCLDAYLRARDTSHSHLRVV